MQAADLGLGANGELVSAVDSRSGAQSGAGIASKAPSSAATAPMAGDLRGRTLRDAVLDYERVLIQILARVNGNWSAAARGLGLHRTNLPHLAKRLGLL